MDLGNLLASAAHGGVQGWVAGQRRENEDLARQKEETRHQELLMRREEMMNKYKPVGVREDGSIVFGGEYEPGMKVYKDAPKQEENPYLKELGQIEEAFGPEGAAAYKNKALGVGKPEKTELGTLYRTPDGTTYTEGQLAQMQQQGQLPEGLYKVGNEPKGDDDLEKRKLYMDAYKSALGNMPTPEDRAAAAQYAEEVSGLKLAAPTQSGEDSSYPNAKPGHTKRGWLSNHEETAQMVAIDQMDGVSEQDIRKKLVEAGWKREDMEKIFEQVEASYGSIINKKDSTPAAQTPQEKKTAYSKEALAVINSNPQYKERFEQMTEAERADAIRKIEERLRNK